MIKKNTPELWDKIWKPSSLKEDLFRIKKAENSIQWKRIEKEVIKKFGSFKNLKVIEIGAGSGTYSFLFKIRGAEVYVLDYSQNALKRSEIFFDRQNAEVHLIFQNALKLNENLIGEFDISMFFGLAEHFKGIDRTNIIKSHFEVLKENGITFIAVPNKWNIPYLIWKGLSEAFGKWRFGEEYPFTQRELIKISKSLNKRYFFLGDSLKTSLEFLDPVSRLKRMLKIEEEFDLNKIKKEKGTFLDKYISYSLVLVGTNKNENINSLEKL